MAGLRFWKMHGLGNDYLVFDNRESLLREPEFQRFARRVCRRRFSVGADGVIALCTPTRGEADFRMRIFNADGSEAEMCGNGIRCLAKYIYENKLSQKRSLRIETIPGVRVVGLEVSDGTVRSVSVDMGSPEFDRQRITVVGAGDFINQPIPLDSGEVVGSCVSMGNPHCVIFVEDLGTTPVDALGPQIENHSLFPQRTNVEFVKVNDRRNISVRTWERGCGETLACGTGACASAVISNLLGKTEKEVTVHLNGGELHVTLAATVVMKGPASKVYEGTLSEEEWK